MKLNLPEDLTTLTADELAALASAADAEFTAVAEAIGTSTPTPEQLADLEALEAASAALDARSNEAAAEDAQRADAARDLLAARAARTAPAPEPEEEELVVEPEPDVAAEVVAEAEAATAQAAEPVTASSSTFKGLAARKGAAPANVAPKAEIGFRMARNVPKFREGTVGYKELAAVVNGQTPTSIVHANRGPVKGFADQTAMSLASLERDFGTRVVTAETLDEAAEQVEAIVAGYTYQKAQFDQDGAITAGAGWCSPSETSYEFCGVSPAEGLLSLPDMNISRGGIRRPMEMDFSELYATLPFRYTEAQLLTNPTKPCVEIPCVEFEEKRVEALGLCITAGILQRRSYPESIEHFMQEAMKAHQIKVSLWSIDDMVSDSTAIVFPAAALPLGSAGSILNSISLRAEVIRQKERVGRETLIEGVAPSWLLAAAQADMALQQGRDVKSVTDAEIDAWLADRNVRIQWVSHWQPLPESSVYWPGSAQVLLYPSGAWYRHLANVIELGTLYDKAMLQLNRYTALFTEDEYLVDRRCKVSEVLTIPICTDGSIGARESITCSAGADEVQTLTITGTPTGGTWTASFLGEATGNLAHNASAATVATALKALPTIGVDNVTVSGSAGGPYTVTFVGELAKTNVPLVVTADALTGGTSPEVTVAQTTAGAPN